MKFRTSVPREIACFILQACFRSTFSTRRRPQLVLRFGRKSCGGSGGSPTCFAACTKIKSWWPSCPSPLRALWWINHCTGTDSTPCHVFVRRFRAAVTLPFAVNFCGGCTRICSSTVLKIMRSSSSPKTSFMFSDTNSGHGERSDCVTTGRRY